MKKMLALLLAGIMVFSMVACGEETKTEDTKEETKTEAKAEETKPAENEVKEEVVEEVKEDADIVGSYVATSFDAGEEELTAEDEEAINALLEGFAIEIKEDGACTLSLMGETADGEWVLEDDQISFINESGDELVGEVSDGAIALDLDGVIVVFEKE